MVNIMRKLAEPLLMQTKINNFSYLKFYHNGAVVNLTTNIDWIKYRFNEKIKYQILFEHELNNIILNNPYIYLWPQDVNSNLLGALRQYGIWNGCNIYIRSTDNIEVFSFASSIENIAMQNFYVNNFDFLKGFIVDFREKIAKIINTNHRIITDINFPIIRNSNKIIKPKTYFDFCISEKPKKIHFDENIYLTIKEIECCSYLIKGMGIKEIAQITNLSSRTVESHINNAKIRSNSLNKQELICYLNKNKWIINSLFPD